jgi:AraC-like DNA-binding protein
VKTYATGTRRPDPAGAARPATSDGGDDQSKAARFGEFTVACIEQDSRGRTAELRALLNAPTANLLVVIAGEVKLRHPDLSATLHRRDSAILLGAARLDLTVAAGTRVVLCSVPGTVVGLTLVPPSMPFVVARADAAVPSAIGALLFDLFQDDVHHSIAVRQEISAMLESLIPDAATVIALGARKGWDRRRQRHAALRYVATHYADPDLDPDAVAAHLGISLRALQRLFEGERGLTQHIRAVRAQAAVLRLRDTNLASASLDDIATLSGFPNPLAMSRTVQEVTGLVPEDLRASAPRG